MREEVGVHGDARVALHEALGEDVEQQAKRMVHRAKPLQEQGKSGELVKG